MQMRIHRGEFASSPSLFDVLAKRYKQWLETDGAAGLGCTYYCSDDNAGADAQERSALNYQQELSNCV
jgi:hypothetical protein